MSSSFASMCEPHGTPGSDARLTGKHTLCGFSITETTQPVFNSCTDWPIERGEKSFF